MRLFGLKIFILINCLIACSQRNENKVFSEEKNPYPYYIDWDKSSLVCIDKQGGYPRMRKLNDGSLLVVYENYNGDVLVKKSFNQGNNWENQVIAYKNFTYTLGDKTTKVNIANPEIIELKNGDILLACNLRPEKEGIFPFSISIKRSKDKGITWSDGQIIFSAGKEFKNGCWEPSFLALPNGSLHLYFANESSYVDSDEQEISVFFSFDEGLNWEQTPRKVSFRKNHRDGMPIAIHNNKEIFVAIEDNFSKEFKPYIVKTSVDNPWHFPVEANSPFRYSALEEELPNNIYAGAPYLIYTEDGFYILSYQTTQNRMSNWEYSTMKVAISKTPDNFKYYSEPFAVPLNKQAKWNSLTDLGNKKIAALSSTDFNSSTSGIWLIKGNIVEK